MADADWKSKKDPKVWRKAVKKYEANSANDSKTSAKYKLRTAVRNGSIKKPSKCSRCGRSGVRIIAHHYAGHTGDAATKVRWVCDLCHSQVDKARSGKKIGAAVKKTLAGKK